MKAPLYTKQGNKKGEIVLNPEIYASQVNERLLELVRNAFAANLRHGTADTKTRKEVQGGGKKPWKQKGTGRARHGSIRSPIWRGGGTTFGPTPRSYFVNLPKGMKRKALISALSLRGDQKNLFLLEDVKLDSAKTKEWAGIVNALPLNGKRAVCVVKEVDTNLQRASQNIEYQMKIMRASDLNAYHILQREKLVIEQDALPVLEARLNVAEVEAETATEQTEVAAKPKKTGVKTKGQSKKRATPKKKSKS